MLANSPRQMNGPSADNRETLLINMRRGVVARLSWPRGAVMIAIAKFRTRVSLCHLVDFALPAYSEWEGVGEEGEGKGGGVGVFCSANINIT